jgi:hypothetical protein
MSEVISFRLDKTNPREARALEVLNAYIELGYSARFILTKALLELDHPGSDLEMSQDGHDLDVVLEQMGQVLEIVKSMKADPTNRQDLSIKQLNLNDSFLASIKQGVKPGMKPG